jgi:hypothetical protein
MRVVEQKGWNMSYIVKPTEYNGIAFRSRTEARWAVVFEQLGWDYQYEPEIFDLPIGRYLPDFYLPSQQAYFEVKPKEPNYKERSKASQLCEATCCTVVVSTGRPNPRRSDFDDDILVFVPEMVEDDRILAFDYRGGFVNRRWNHHPACSLSLGNLAYLGAETETDWQAAFNAAAKMRFSHRIH